MALFFENHNKETSHRGRIEVICGSMFSGKTEELIRRIRRAKFAKQRVEIFKPSIDIRYSEEDVVSHDSHTISSTPVDSSGSILPLSSEVDVVGIDEAQFFDKGIVRICNQIADNGTRVIIAGLDMDFKGKPFGAMPELCAIADEVTNLKTYKNAVINGINYLFKAQYNNGGWPQFYPRPVGYYIQITYNDNAMVNVMKLLRDVYKKKSPYAFIPDSICQKAKSSFDKGIECILNTQVRNKKGELTVWCAQHDKNSLKPCKARAYELPSLSGQESDGIVLLLMGIKHPSQRITNAIKGAIKWYNESEIKGLKKEFFTNSKGKRDFKMIPCDNCQPMWARFYDLDTNRPFFCDRDGIKKDDISQIGYERRNGYKWYNKDGFTVLGKYKKWKEKNLK